MDRRTEALADLQRRNSWYRSHRLPKSRGHRQVASRQVLVRHQRNIHRSDFLFPALQLVDKISPKFKSLCLNRDHSTKLCMQHHLVLGIFASARVAGRLLDTLKFVSVAHHLHLLPLFWLPASNSLSSCVLRSPSLPASCTFQPYPNPS